MAFEVFRQVYEILFDEYSPPGPGDTVLDVGAKDGVIAGELARRYGCRTLSLDMTFNLSQEASEWTSCVYADGRFLPIRDDSLHAVITNMLFEHIPDESLLIEDAARALRPEGILVAIFPNRAWPLDTHGFVPFTPWVPRWVGKRLLALSQQSDRHEYYDRYMHPSFSLTVRRELKSHFEEVRFEAERLLEVDYREDNRKGKALRAVNGPLRKLLSLPGASSAVEATFPVSIYSARYPVG